MGLTSLKLQLLIAILAIAAMAFTIWFWPRLAARGWRPVMARAGVLVASQALILAAFGLVGNAHFGFFATWSDLLGTDRGTAEIVAQGSAQVQILSERAVPGAPGSRLQEVVLRGRETGLSAPAYVYLPPQYFKRKGARFPVMLVLTGYPGDARNLLTRNNYPLLAAQAIRQGRMHPTIMVLMRPTVAPPRDTECVDVPGGPQAETFFTKDVRAALSTRYRVGTEAANWGVIGGSTGGYCALKMTMRHPEAFSAAVALSGNYRAMEDATTGDLFGGSDKLRKENDLLWRLRNLPAPAVKVLVTSSRQEKGNYRPTKEFLAAVKAPMQASSLILPTGGHNFATWNRQLPQALPWLGQQLHVPPPGETASVS